MRHLIVALTLAGCQHPAACPTDTCGQPGWEITGAGLELDNLTRVAVVGRAAPVQGDDVAPAAVAVEYEVHDPETGEWDLVLASVPLDLSGEQEFVVVSDDVRYWPVGDGADEVCATLYPPAPADPIDLGCLTAE